MRKIQVTIAIYVLVVFIVSVFFMPMDRNLIVSSSPLTLDTVTYHPVWDTNIDKDSDSYEFLSIDIGIYKLFLSILTTLCLSIIAIQVIGLLKQFPIPFHIHRQRIEDND